jgi:hypothetical protein
MEVFEICFSRAGESAAHSRIGNLEGQEVDLQDVVLDLAVAPVDGPVGGLAVTVWDGRLA